MAGRLKIGQLLVAQGLIHPDQLAAALAAQEDGSARVGMALVAMGALAEEDLIRVLAHQLGVQVARLGGKTLSAEILDLVPGDVAAKHRCLPLFFRDDESGEALVLGMEDPSDDEAVAEVAQHAGCRLRPVLIAPSELERALARYYRNDAAAIAGSPLADVDVDLEEPPEPEAHDLAPLTPAFDGATPEETSRALPTPDWMDEPETASTVEDDAIDDLFTAEAPDELGDLPDLDDTLAPLDADDASLGLSGSTLSPGASSAVEDRALGDLEASFEALEDDLVGGADPGASWSEVAEDPSLGDDAFGADDSLAEFEKEPFAAAGAPPAQQSASDDVGKPAAAESAREDAARQNAILQALAQLLVEKGVITREEFAARLRKLTSG